MFKKVSLRLAVLSILLFAQSQGNPAVESENKDGIQAAAARDARISPSDWLHFNHSWSFPSLPSVTGLFGGDDKEGRGFNLRKRVDALEKAQKSMNEMLTNLTRDVAALTASFAGTADGSTIIPVDPVTDIPDVATESTSLPEGTLPAKPATSKPDITSGFPSLPEGALPVKPEATEAPATDTLMVVPLKTTANATPNLSSDAPEIPEKIVIASTSLEDTPGENPFGSISLVGFAPSHDSRHNSRMPWNKDQKLTEKAN